MAQTTLWCRLGLSSSLLVSLGNPFPFRASLSLSFPLECVLMLWGAYKGGSSHATLVVAKHDSRRGASRTVVGVVDVGRGSAVVSISPAHVVKDYTNKAKTDMFLSLSER